MSKIFEGDVDEYAAYMQEKVEPSVDADLLTDMKNNSHEMVLLALAENPRALYAYGFMVNLLLFDGKMQCNEGKVPRWLDDLMAEYALGVNNEIVWEANDAVVC